MGNSKFKKVATKVVAVSLSLTTAIWLSGAAMALPLAAKAATLDELMAQIAALQAQVVALQGGGSTLTAPGHSFKSNLTMGSKGADVTALQQILIDGGHLKIAAPTGYFGALTKVAVAAWQKEAGLPSTGYFGSLSRAKASEMGGGTTPSPTPSPSPSPAPSATGITVSMAGPAASTLLTTQSLAPLANFTLTGNGKVTGVSLKRIGVSADTTMSNVYLFDGAMRITDAASVASGSVINFSGLDVAVTGSKTLSVKADMAGTAGETVGVQMTGLTLASGGVKGLPLSGNLHTMSVATLASVALGAATASGNADPTTDMLVWQSTATVSTRDVTLNRLALRQIGSINSADIKNFKLLVDGVQLASQDALDSNGYVTFSVPKKLTTGARVLRVQADVVGGSGRTVQMSLRGAYDISVTDSQYNADLVATAAGGFPLGATAWTVNAGTMTVAKATDSASQNVTIGATDVPLAKYTFTANGEKIKVETLRVGVITTGGTVTDHTLRNVRILVNGTQVGSTTNVPAAAAFAAAAGTSFTTNFTVTPGTPTMVEIRGDIFDSEGTNDIATPGATAVQALLVGGTGTSNAVPAVSLGTINVPSQQNVLGNTLTIASGSLTLSQTSNYGNQTIVVPQTAYKLASYNLVGNATEAVNINTFELDFAQPNGTTFDASDDLTDLYIKYGTSMTSVKGTVTDADNTWSTSFTLAKNETKTIEVYATLGSTVTAADSIRADLTVTGVTADSAITVYADSNNAGANSTVKDAGFQGQTITANAGSITVSVDPSRPNSALLDDSGTVTSAAFKFDAVNDNYTVTDVTLTLANSSAVRNVTLMDGTTALASRPGNTTVTFNGLTLAVQAGSPKILSVALEMGTVGVGAGATGSSVLTTMTAATARNSQGVSAAVSGTSVAGQVMYAYRSVPTITNVALPSSVLVGGSGSHTLAKFTIGTGATGATGWAKLVFTVNKSITGGGDTVTSPTLWDVTSGATQILGATVISGLGAGANGSITFLPNTEQQVSGAKTYELRAVVGGNPVAGNSLTTQIAQPSPFAASVAAYATHSASSVNYYDVSTPGTVTGGADGIGDIRQTAQSQFTTVDVSVAANTTGHNASGKIEQAYGITGDITLTLPEFTTDNVIDGATFTVTGAGSTGLTCTPFTQTGGTGAVTTQVTTFNAIQSVVCSGTGKALRIHSLTVTNDSGTNTGNGGLIIVITKAADYALGSRVASTDSDTGLTLTGGVAPAASFVWSDLSASSHSLNTLDWTNGLFVRNLPTDTQNLVK